jgi:hypothetical protein
VVPTERTFMNFRAGVHRDCDLLWLRAAPTQRQDIANAICNQPPADASMSNPISLDGYRSGQMRDAATILIMILLTGEAVRRHQLE